jgi:hypothetical protein
MKPIKTFVVAITGLLLAAASSHAALTTVNDIWGPQPGGGGGEWNLYNTGVGGNAGNGIMEYLYGAGNFTRVDDSSDIQWVGSPGGATFDAVYAADGENLYTAGLPGNPTSFILTGSATAGAPSISATTVPFTPVSQPFLFLDEATSGSSVVTYAYSNPALNGGVDRMVTFLVTGYYTDPVAQTGWTAFTEPTYVIAFEDGTDYDYNDLVVQVSGVAPVPEPTTMLAGALLLLPFGASTLRILRRNRTA